ncbi:uncharacterized protein [Centroberyx affinis]|uniref:uncharacterized protein isoform X2 n=1 Tax=Centroberyx affinis TaxID=166261 RepID=UPI003A5BE2E7
MDRRVCFCLVTLSLLGSVVAQEETHSELGGKLVLEPDTSAVSKPINNILWKHGVNMVAEWFKDIPVDYYGQFKGRTKLETSTGQLVISALAANDSGVYSVEFNNKLQSKKYKIIVISKIQKATVFLQPVACDSSSPNCTLGCDGGSPEAEPITYSWRTDGGAWEKSTQLKSIINDDKWHKIKKISCQMKNPISVEESEPHDNPFWSEPSYGWIAAVVIGLVVFAVIVVLKLKTGLLDNIPLPCLKTTASNKTGDVPASPNSGDPEKGGVTGPAPSADGSGQDGVKGPAPSADGSGQDGVKGPAPSADGSGQGGVTGPAPSADGSGQDGVTGPAPSADDPQQDGGKGPASAPDDSDQDKPIDERTPLNPPDATETVF